MHSALRMIGLRNRAVLRSSIVWVSLNVTAAASAQDHLSTFLKGPYLQAPGADTMAILWESPTNRPGIVRFGLNGQLDLEQRIETPRELKVVSGPPFGLSGDASARTNAPRSSVTNLVFLYEVILTNLQAHSVYSYSAETGGVSSPPKKFKTFGAHPEQVTFIAYGDTRTNPKIHAAIAANFKRHSPDFILHTGDLVTNGRRHEQWGREFFAPLAEVIDEVPILPAIGNHEEDGINYLHYLHLPGKELWYSYDVGPVHVLSLDYRSARETHERVVSSPGVPSQSGCGRHRDRRLWTEIQSHDGREGGSAKTGRDSVVKMKGRQRP